MRAEATDDRARGASAEATREGATRAPFLARLDAIVAAHARAPALEEPDRELSYAALADAVAARASELAALGVSRGDWVLVARERSAALVVDLLAIASLDAAFLPIDAATPAERRAAIERDAGIGWTIDDARGLARRGPPSHARERLAYVIYTSGSSGAPKGVRVPHDGVVPMIDAQIAAFELGPGARALAYLSPGFDAFLSDVLTALLAGATLVIAPSERLRSIDGLVSTLHERRITHLDLPPSLVPHLDPGALPSTMRTVVVGGEAASIEPLRALARRVRVVNVYGPTEATICTSLCVVDPARWDRPLLGDPLPGVSYRAVDGELWIASPGLARGYVGRDEETARAFVEHEGTRSYRTGDRVRHRADGAWEFLGRLDRQVKLAGQRIELEEVESVLRGAPGVREAAVLVRAEGLVAFVEGDATPAALRASARRALPRAAVPRRWSLVPAMPRTASGKVDREALAALAIDDPVPPDQAPRGAEEKAWAALFARVLGRASVARTASFWDLGGDSLAAMELAALAESMRMPLPPARLADAASIAELALGSIDDRHDADRDASEIAAEGALAWSRVAPAEARARATPGAAMLLTGATGFLGARTLAELLRRTDLVVHCLVRARDDDDARRRIEDALAVAGLALSEAERARVRACAGDAARLHLGLSTADYDPIARSLCTIVHAAGRVAVTADARALHAANVAAVAQVARLASDSGARLVHASSLAPFVCARPRPARIAEHDVTPSGRVAGHYAASKLAAEHVVRASGVPSALVRFGLLTGDSATGRSHDACQLSLFLRGVAAIGVVPAIERRLELDVTPVDHAARALAIIAADERAEGVLHVASAEPASLEDLLEALRAAGVSVRRAHADAFFDAVTARAASGDEVGTAALGLLRHARDAERALETDLFLATGVRWETARTDALLRGAGAPACPPATPALLARYARAALAPLRATADRGTATA